MEETFISITLVTVIISLPGNIFIIVVNVLDFWKSRRLAVSDRLILGFSTFSFIQGLHEGYMLYRDLLELPNIQDTFIFMYLILCTLWFSTLLSIHFSLKIVNINCRFYVCLQRRLPPLFPWIIMAFLLGYFILALYSALEAKPECLLNTTTSVSSMKKSLRCSWSLLMFLTICFLCASLCLVSASTILISLLKHMTRIKHYAEGSGSPNIEAHVRAVRTVTSLLATNSLIFASGITLTLTYESWAYLFAVLILICHMSSSYFLIKGTKKLNKMLEDIMNWCPCWRA